MENKTVEQHLRRLQQLEGEASNIRNTWQELANNFQPHKAYITETYTPGEKHNYERLYDITPMLALDTFAAGIHGYLTNPATSWFTFIPLARELKDLTVVKLYFHEVAEILRDVLNRSNFYQNAHEVYKDEGCFGTAVMSIEQDAEDIVRFDTLNLSECSIAEDAAGRVNTLYRTFSYTIEQAYLKWGTKIGEKSMEKLRAEKWNETFNVVHCIFPRDVYEIGKTDSKNLPVGSLWIGKDEKITLSEGGFHEFPFAVPRADKTSGGVWGNSLAMRVLPAARGIQKMTKTVLRSGMKQTDPPLVMPKRSAILPLNLNPSALNFMKRGFTAEDIKPLAVHGNTGIGVDLIQMSRDDIKNAFFNDLFVALGEISKQMTVPEVNQRIYEKMILLGPMIGRTMKEYLDVTLARVYRIVAEAGYLPEPPQELQGQLIVPDYISPLATSQKMATKSSIEAALYSVAQMGQIDPSVYDRIDLDETAEYIMNISGVPPRLIRDDDAVDEMRQERAEKQRVAEIAELAQRGTEIAKNSSIAAKNNAEAAAV